MYVQSPAKSRRNCRAERVSDAARRAVTPVAAPDNTIAWGIESEPRTCSVAAYAPALSALKNIAMLSEAPGAKTKGYASESRANGGVAPVTPQMVIESHPRFVI